MGEPSPSTAVVPRGDASALRARQLVALVNKSFLLDLDVRASRQDQEDREALLGAAYRTADRIGTKLLRGLILMPDAATTGFDDDGVPHPDVQGAAYVVEPHTPAALVVGDAALATDFCGVIMSFEFDPEAIADVDMEAIAQRLRTDAEKLERKLDRFDAALEKQRAAAERRPAVWPPTDGRQLAVLGTTSTSVAIERHDAHDAHAPPRWRLIGRIYDAAASQSIRALIERGATVADVLKAQNNGGALEASKRLARQLAAYVGAFLQLPDGALRTEVVHADIGGVEARDPSSVNVYNVFDEVERRGGGAPLVVYYRRALSTRRAAGALEFGRTRELGHVAFGGAPWEAGESAHAFPLGRPRRHATRAVAYEVREDVEDEAAAKIVGFAQRGGQQPFSPKLRSAAYADLRDELQHTGLIDVLRRLGWRSSGGGGDTAAGAARIWKTRGAYLSPWSEGRDVQRADFLLLMKAFAVDYTVTLSRTQFIALLQHEDAQRLFAGRPLFAGELADERISLSVSDAIVVAELIPTTQQQQQQQ